MRPSKNPRQSRIIQIIKHNDISTQDELVQNLRKSGMEVTQATISRDIKELGIIKISTAHGKQKYALMSQSGDALSGRLMKVFTEALITIKLADNLVILKTLPGMAQAAAAALDSMRLPEIIGCLAGDDTVFVASCSQTEAKELREALIKLSKLDPGLIK